MNRGEHCLSILLGQDTQSSYSARLLGLASRQCCIFKECSAYSDCISPMMPRSDILQSFIIDIHKTSAPISNNQNNQNTSYYGLSSEQPRDRDQRRVYPLNGTIP